MDFMKAEGEQMDLNELAGEIRSECGDKDGFLVQLHSHSTFDDERYRSLVEHISTYADLLSESDRIDRSVAGCLFELMSAVTTALDSFAQLGHPDLQKVRRAHAELAELLHNKVFSTPSSKDNGTLGDQSTGKE